MPLDSNYGTMLRRWYLVDGEPRCPFDAIDKTIMSVAACSAVTAQNIAASQAWSDYIAYLDARALSAQPEPPATITDGDGNTVANPDHAAWVAAGQTVTNASAVTLALVTVRGGEPPAVLEDGSNNPDHATWVDACAILDAANIGFILTRDLGADPLTADAAKADLTAYAASVRYGKETGGIVVNGAQIATDRVSQAMISGAYNYVQQNPSATINWKSEGGFVTLDTAAIKAVANAVGAHVQACFATEASVSANIASGTITTMTQIDTAFAG